MKIKANLKKLAFILIFMKKIIYIIATIFLGILLSLLAHVYIEIIYLQYAQAHNIKIVWNTALGESCSLPIILQLLIMLSGILGGYYLGQFWWRKVYVENAYKRFKK